MYLRKQIFKNSGDESIFFWGARQTGKSTLLAHLYKEHLYIDLLLSDQFEKFSRNPSLFREICLAYTGSQPVIIDEIQLLPVLLNEVHWLIVNKNMQFLLSGSSPRKILRTGANLLGGRALKYELYPLVSSEIPDFDIIRALNHGLLPRHYISNSPEKLLSAYIGSYLQDEIMAEAKVRNISSFNRFLEVAAFSNGETINYSNIAGECGVSPPTAKEYFQILEDTLIGRFLPSFQKKPKRRIIHSPRFYFFDVGIANYLLKRKNLEPGNELFGKAFEHFIYQELYAYSHYSDANFPISFWRTTSGIEVDFILGDHEVAIEVKSTSQASGKHLKGLRAFAEEYQVRRLILVSLDDMPRKVDDCEILPWQLFLKMLWNGEIMG